MPSHDTFNRVFAAINPLQFRECFLGWTRSVASALSAQVIALDGKVLRGSGDSRAGRGPIHMLQRHPTKRGASIRTRRLLAGWDRAYFLKLLTGN